MTWHKNRVKRPRGESYTEWLNGPWTILEQNGNTKGATTTALSQKTIFELSHTGRWRGDFKSLAEAKRGAR